MSREFFLTSFIKQTNNKKRNYAFEHESVLHRVISVQPRNLVKKRNLAHFGGILWPLYDAASESRGCVPKCDTHPPRVTPKEPRPCCSRPRQCHVPHKLYSLCFMTGVPKTAISTCRNILCVVQRTKDAWFKPVAGSWFTSKAAVPYSHSYTTQQKCSIKYLHICVCVREQSVPVHFLNYRWWLQASSKAARDCSFLSESP